jgi:hypothetical protein
MDRSACNNIDSFKLVFRCRVGEYGQISRRTQREVKQSSDLFQDSCIEVDGTIDVFQQLAKQ